MESHFSKKPMPPAGADCGGDELVGLVFTRAAGA